MTLCLMVRMGPTLFAIPVSEVAETLRVLPIDPLPDVPLFVLGLMILHGSPVVAVDLARLLGQERTGKRVVVLKVGSRQVALVVESVVGLREISDEALHDTPPLLNARYQPFVDAIGASDNELFMVLNAARSFPDDLWGVAG